MYTDILVEFETQFFAPGAGK